MKLKMVLIVCISLIAIMSIGAISASEDIANDTVTAIEPADEAIIETVEEIEPTDEVISQPADDEIYAADESEEILTDEVFEPKVIKPFDDYFFDNTDRIGVTLTNTFSLGEKFNVGVDAPGANGTFRVYYAGVNGFGPYKFNNTVLASGDIVDGIGVAELSIPQGGNPIYTVDYDMIDYWIEYDTNKGSGNLSFFTLYIENNKNISAEVKPLEFTEGGNNNVTLKFSSPVEGLLQYYLDGVGEYSEHDFIDVYSKEKTFEYLSVGTHNIRVFFRYDPQYDGVGTFSKTFTVTVKEYVPVIVQAVTKITSSAVALTYNTNAKTVTFTLKDEDGNTLPSQPVALKFNGKTYDKATNSKGQVTLSVSSLLIPKAYTATLKFAGDESYKASSKSVKVTVNKATPKITAKAKTFKKSVKTKKYSITLKNNQNKVLKNTKVTIKVNKKTYSTKTNSKGVATFKITKLTKKGKYAATVKFAGSNYYKAKSAKVYITVK